MRGNIYSYLRRNGNYTFDEKPFNEIDNLILAELSYLPFKEIVPSFNEGYITIKEAEELFARRYTCKQLKKIANLLLESRFLLKKMASSKRFQDAILYNYVKIVDNEKQFGALTIELSDKSVYVSYEGTDTSVIGWEEDLQLSYKFPVSSQKLAGMYLNSTVHLFDHKVRVGGHSKGGNLAMAAAMNCNFLVRKKIIEVYNNDGPGFLKKEIESRRYQLIAPKIKMIVPSQCVVGMFLYHVDNYKVVKSTNRGIMQHDAFSWVCDDDKFVTTNLSKNSRGTELNLSKWVESLKPEDREACVNELFKVFKENNISDLTEINVRNFLKLVKGLKNIKKTERDKLIKVFKIVAFEK